MAIATPIDTAGYDYEFVNTPSESLVCKICHLPSRDPYLSVCCGHNFCKPCLDNYKKATTIDIKVCPVCRGSDFTKFPNKLSDREIRNLHVMCTNKERGCEWQGELNDINNHLRNKNGCQFEDVKCVEDCGKVVKRQYLTSHVKTECPRRKVDCHYCQISGEHQFIEESVPREDLNAHRKECPLEVVQCEYHNVGCEERMMRKKRMKHEKDKMEEHLLMTKLKLAKTENKLTSTEIGLNSMEVMLHRLIDSSEKSSIITDSVQWSIHLNMMANTTRVCPVILKLSGFAEYKEKGRPWTSEPFYTHNNGYKMCLTVDPAGWDKHEETHLSAYLCLMKGPHDDELTWPLRGMFQVKLLNQTDDCNHHSFTMTFTKYHDEDIGIRVTDANTAQDGWGFPDFISNENLYKVTSTCQYLIDDALFLQISALHTKT
ncbi:TNF receptor-associated factor 4-like [Dysidea avara]|uniref:TNF receptor-associated factor 4-like n=1 Tax=Dysidea avara TaxID=196820 RepID=UPI00332D4324